MTFSVRIDEAKEAGRQLAGSITDKLEPRQEVFFVAHSLGCRVVLEALYTIAGRRIGRGAASARRCGACFSWQARCRSGSARTGVSFGAEIHTGRATGSLFYARLGSLGPLSRWRVGTRRRRR